MTDEEARKIAISVVGYANDVSEVNVELVKEGYRAALEEAWQRFISPDGIAKTLAWLEKQVKK